jgi:glycosyltransferase involved in cell wall biosynthesis
VVLKILASHPVQYQAPIFQKLPGIGVDVDVTYYHEGSSLKARRDSEFGTDFKWDLDLLSHYQHRILLHGKPTFGLLEQIIAFVKLRNLLRDRKIPVLFMGWFAEVVWVIWAWRVFTGAPTIIISETNKASYRGRGFRRVILRALLKRTHAVLFIGQRNYEFLLDMGVRADVLIHSPYSIDNARFADAAALLRCQRAALSREFGLDEKRPTFLFCGKLIEKKRPDALLNAYLDGGLDGDAQLVFVGSGHLEESLRQRVKEANARNVHFLGFLNQTRMPLAYAVSDILCLPSDSDETWGLVVNEALACGLPTIVSTEVGCCDDLIDESNGWIVPLQDTNALTTAMKSALAARPMWPSMRTCAVDRVSRHTFDAIARAIQTAALRVTREGTRQPTEAAT